MEMNASFMVIHGRLVTFFTNIGKVFIYRACTIYGWMYSQSIQGMMYGQCTMLAIVLHYLQVHRGP